MLYKHLGLLTLAYYAVIHVFGLNQAGGALYAASSANGLVILSLLSALVVVCVLYGRGHKKRRLSPKVNLILGIGLIFTCFAGLFNLWFGPALSYHYEIIDYLVMGEAGALLSLSAATPMAAQPRKSWAIPSFKPFSFRRISLAAKQKGTSAYLPS